MAALKSLDSTPGDPSTTPRVIGAGYSRTGTVSFTLALQKLLNGPVCHTGSVCFKFEESFIKRFCSIGEADPVKDRVFINKTLRSLFSGYVAVTDSPVALFTGELVDLYPDAVVICTTRDPARWWQSTQELEKTVTPWWLDLLFFPVPGMRYFKMWMKALGPRHDFIYGYGAEKQRGTDHLRVHEEYLRRVVPAARLFFFDVKDGWAPLCRILDCPIPDEPFPHANEKAAMEEFFGEYVKDALVRWIQIMAAGVILITSGAWASKYYWS